jgi:hypothetical protein
MSLAGSQISGNDASGSGGGIYNESQNSCDEYPDCPQQRGRRRWYRRPRPANRHLMTPAVLNNKPDNCVLASSILGRTG